MPVAESADAIGFGLSSRFSFPAWRLGDYGFYCVCTVLKYLVIRNGFDCCYGLMWLDVFQGWLGGLCLCGVEDLW
jgi:hypothetical protein